MVCLFYSKYKATWLIRMQFVVLEMHLTQVGEVTVMTLSMKHMNFVDRVVYTNHSHFRKVISWSLPLQYITIEIILILLLKILFFFRYK